ncbi:GNAT family N-acetyltransferase [Oceanobacillus sp. CAU 1775]
MLETIKTENYILRAIRISDTPALYDMMSDKETMQFITPHPVKSIEQMNLEVRESLNKLKAKKELPWVILSSCSNEIIGTFDFHKVNTYHRKAEMRAIIKKEFQQKGVMTEVLKVMLNYGFNDLNLNRIVGDIFAGNKGSQRLLEEFGFKKEGILRETDFDGETFHDTVVYSLLRREYNQNNEVKYGNL